MIIMNPQYSSVLGIAHYHNAAYLKWDEELVEPGYFVVVDYAPAMDKVTLLVSLPEKIEIPDALRMLLSSDTGPFSARFTIGIYRQIFENHNVEKNRTVSIR